MNQVLYVTRFIAANNCCAKWRRVRVGWFVIWFVGRSFVRSFYSASGAMDNFGAE